MILTVYKELVLIAEEQFSDIVLSADIMFTSSNRAQKLRVSLIDDTFVDIWLTLDGRYSYHWHSFEKFIYRHDNAPHEKWNFVSTFPKHCHDGKEKNVTASDIPDDYRRAMQFFMGKVREKLRE